MFEQASVYTDIYRALVGGRGGSVAINDITRREAVPQEVRVDFVVGTFLTVLTWWLERRPTLRPPEVAAIFRHLAIARVGPSAADFDRPA